MSVRTEQKLSIVVGLAFGITFSCAIIWLAIGFYKSFYSDPMLGLTLFFLVLSPNLALAVLSFGSAVVTLRTGETWFSYFRQKA